MSRTDIKNSISVVSSLAPASRTAAVDGTGVDLAGFDAACIVIDAGASGGTTPSFTFEVQDSPDNSTYTAVAAEFLDGTEPVVTTDTDNAVYEIGYRGIARYVRVTIEAATGTSPTLVCAASVVRGKARKYPA